MGELPRSAPPAEPRPQGTRIRLAECHSAPHLGVKHFPPLVGVYKRRRNKSITIFYFDFVRQVDNGGRHGLNWNALYGFWLVAESHSFAAASRVLRPGSTQALQTEAGRRIHELLSPIFRDIDRLTTELRGEDSGPLHVAASNFSAHDFMPDILAAFCPKFPCVSVHLHMREPQEVVVLAEAGRVDFGICAFLTRLEKCEVKIETPLPLAILLPKGHRFRRGIPSWKELLQEPLILPEPGTLIRSILDELVNRQKLSDRLRVNAELSSTPDISAGAVRAGLGAAIVAVGPDTRMNRRGVVQVEPPPGLRQVRLSVICRKNRYLPKYMHAFVDAAAAVMLRYSETALA